MKIILDAVDEFLLGLERLSRLFKKEPKSLLGTNIAWMTDSTWVQRLVAFKQIDQQRPWF